MKIYCLNTINKRNICKKIFSFLFIFLVLILIILLILKTFIFKSKYFDIVLKEASKNNIDPYLIMAIIKVESGFDPNAISAKEAKGLMQIKESTAIDINEKYELIENFNVKEDIFDEENNIIIGCKYFDSLLRKYNGNIYLSICAYNAGMGNVDKWLESDILTKDFSNYKQNDIPFFETKNYLKKIINVYNIYNLLY